MKSRYVKISCTEHGKMIMLDPNTQSAFVRCKKPDGFSVLNECTISSDGTLLLELTQQMIAVPGKCTVDIMLFYTNLILECTDGDVELSEEGVTLNGLSVTDDNAGNVSVFADETSDFTIQKYTAETIEDIYKLNVPVLSTMTFYLNILPTAIEHTEIESSYEYNALAQGIKNQKLIEDHMKALDESFNQNENERLLAETHRESAESNRRGNETARNEAETLRNTAENERADNEKHRVSNEATRQENEELRKIQDSKREENESKRQTNEGIRTSAENARIANENERISNENARKVAESERVANETSRQQNESARNSAETEREAKTTQAISACNTATSNASDAANNANSAANSANAVITAAETATANANTAAASANAVTEKCQEIIDSRDIANNLSTETEGLVLDATQGKILNDLIASLQSQIDAMHNVYSGTEDPNVADPEGSKDGDVYMLIIEDSTETVGE